MGVDDPFEKSKIESEIMGKPRW